MENLKPGIRLALAVVAAGVLSGLGVLLLVFVVHSIEFAIWGHASGPFLDGLAYPNSRWQPLLVLGLGGLLITASWYALRRWGRRLRRIEDAVNGDQMPALETTADALIQVSSVALGAPIGKEVAPRQLSAMLASKVAVWFRLDPQWGPMLIASAAGAGLAGVYNVPLAGALFALEILLAQFTLPAVIIAMSVSTISTLVSRILVANEPLYRISEVAVTDSLLVAALLVGPLIGGAAELFNRTTKWLAQFSPKGWRLLLVLPPTFAVMGLLGVFFPLILGNGRALAQASFDAYAPALGLLLLAILKYLATTLTLGAGAVGGTLQPSLAIGGALGAAAAMGWAAIWPGAGATELAIAAGAAFLAATMRAPLTAIALALEFTGTGFTLILPIFIAVLGAQGSARWLAGRSAQTTA